MFSSYTKLLPRLGGFFVLCYTICMKYIDKWGEVWQRIDKFYVKRISDGNVGGWFNGQGLIPVLK